LPRHALLIGVTAYESEQDFQPFQAPEEDVNALAEVLEGRGGFELTKSINEEYDQIRRKILRLFAGRKPDDVILLYYSGHGYKDFYGKLYLTTIKSRISSLKDDSVAASEMKSWLADCKAKSQVLILDCCYSGAYETGASRREQGSRVRVSADEFLPEDGYGSFVLMATDRDETAPTGDKADTSFPSSSHYTRLLLEGLEGEAAPDSEHIHVGDLAEFLEREAPKRLRIHPKSSRIGHRSPWLVQNPNAGVNQLPKEVLEALSQTQNSLLRIGAAWRLGRYVALSDPRSRAAKRLLTQRLDPNTEPDPDVRDAVGQALNASLPLTSAGLSGLLAQTERHLEEARSEIEGLHQKASEFESKTEAFQSELNASETRVRDADERARKAEEERLRTVGRRQDVEDELRRLTASVDGLEHKATVAEDRARSLQSDNDGLRSREAELSSSLKLAEEHLVTAKSALETADSTNSKLQKDLTEERTSAIDLRQKVADLERAHERLQKSNGSLQERLDGLDKKSLIKIPGLIPIILLGGAAIFAYIKYDQARADLHKAIGKNGELEVQVGALQGQLKSLAAQAQVTFRPPPQPADPQLLSQPRQQGNTQSCAAGSGDVSLSTLDVVGGDDQSDITALKSIADSVGQQGGQSTATALRFVGGLGNTGIALLVSFLGHPNDGIRVPTIKIVGSALDQRPPGVNIGSCGTVLIQTLLKAALNPDDFGAPSRRPILAPNYPRNRFVFNVVRALSSGRCNTPSDSQEQIRSALKSIANTLQPQAQILAQSYGDQPCP
jgi:hypothetical protein